MILTEFAVKMVYITLFLFIYLKTKSFYQSCKKSGSINFIGNAIFGYVNFYQDIKTITYIVMHDFKGQFNSVILI